MMFPSQFKRERQPKRKIWINGRIYIPWNTIQQWICMIPYYSIHCYVNNLTKIAKWKKTRMKDCTLHDSTYIKFKNRQNSSMATKIRSVVTIGVWGVTGNAHEEKIFVRFNFLIWVLATQMSSLYDNSLSCVLTICVLLWMCISILKVYRETNTGDVLTLLKSDTLPIHTAPKSQGLSKPVTGPWWRGQWLGIILTYYCICLFQPSFVAAQFLFSLHKENEAQKHLVTCPTAARVNTRWIQDSQDAWLPSPHSSQSPHHPASHFVYQISCLLNSYHVKHVLVINLLTFFKPVISPQVLFLLEKTEIMPVIYLLNMYVYLPIR